MSKQVQATPGERSVNNLLDPVHGEFDSFGHHYQQKLFDMLGNIARRKLLLSAVVAVVLMLGLVAMFAVPCSRAATTVSILNTDPGSYTSDTTGSWNREVSVPAIAA